MVKKEKLEKLNREIRNCKKCRLWKLRKNTVPGAGPVNAKIIILGMAPGVEEDKIGKPFIGRAGKFLDKLIKMAQLDRKKISITSVMKCRPVSFSKKRKKT